MSARFHRESYGIFHKELAVLDSIARMHCLSALHFDNSLLSAWSTKFSMAQPPFWNGFCLAELRLQSSLPERIPRTVSNLQSSGQFSL